MRVKYSCFYLIRYYDYFDKVLRLQNVVIFKTRQDFVHSCHLNLDVVSKKVYRNIVSIIYTLNESHVVRSSG